MLLKGIREEDFLQYKKPSMVILFPNCTFKCNKESGCAVCQNSALASSLPIEVSVTEIVNKYKSNCITSSIVFAGLEPFDSFDDMIKLIGAFRMLTLDDIVIYTGYYKEEIADRLEQLKDFSNIIVKFGRFIPHDKPILDEVLGVLLASSNQHAERIS